jgi:Family of unknown function (DUF6356)
MILENLFTDHPRSLGESYLQHQQHALTFGVTMVVAGIACIVHALVPALFETTGSRAVTRLYNRMVVNRKRLSQLTHPRDVVPRRVPRRAVGASRDSLRCAPVADGASRDSLHCVSVESTIVA